MRNAKTEFQEFVKELGVEVLCAQLEDVYYSSPNLGRKWNLPKGYTKKQLIQFWKDIDFDYDDGYGSEELGGVIWFKDGTYANRGQYDGSEWWEYHKTPDIPEELK